MNARQLGDILADFGTHTSSKDREPLPHFAPASPDAEIRSAEDARTDRLEGAHAAARDEGRAEAARDCERRISDMQAAHDARLAQERATWAASEAALLAARIETGLETLEGRIGDSVAAILAPLVPALARERMMDALRQEMAKLLRTEPRSTLALRGPEDLLHGLRHHLEPHVASISFETSSDIDLRVTLGDTLIETRLAAWRDLLQSTQRVASP